MIGSIHILNEPCIDCRIIDFEGYKATIKYIGPVKGAKNSEDIWLGVEWDCIGRGKHNGQSVDENGIIHKYFECSKPNSGSFIKLNKIRYGRSFMEALNERYVSLDAPSIVESDTNSLSDAYVNTLKGNQKSVLFVGEEKIRKRQQISNVTSVAIRNDTIDHINSDVEEIASHLLEIDLQDNLLWRWIEIAKLGSQIPNLKVLLLHGNKFQQITESICSTFPKNCFTNLKVLALNGCGIKTWASLQSLDLYLPSIEELYIANNLLSDLPCLIAEKEYEAATGISTHHIIATVNGFSTLRLLDLTGCGLIEWSQVCYFGKLMNLQELILDNNPLQEVLPPPVDDIFPLLKRFSLSNTNLSSWKDVDILDMYPSLRILRLSQIPLFAGKGSSEVRFEVIARIKQLTFFNGSLISNRERVESEKNYIRCIHYDHNLKFTNDSSSNQLSVNLSVHPRYKELMDLYGIDIIPFSKSTIGPSNLASELINITFKNLSFGSNGSLEPITKKLPRSLLISKLQMLVKQLFGLDPKLQHLSMRLYKDGPPTYLDDEKASLSYYGAIDGAEIFINEGKAV